MKTLTTRQIDLMRADIRHGGIEKSDLEEDILDHICCAMEEEYDEQQPFDELYHRIKSSIFPEGYRTIQETTSYLLSLKYSKMKKTMNVFGVAGSGLLLIGSIMKVLRLVAANELLVLGTASLVLGYLPIMLALSMKNTDTFLGKVRNISGFLGSATIVTGILLKVIHWEWGNVMIIFGLFVFLLIFIPLFVKTIAKDTSININPVTTSVMFLAIISLFFAFNNRQKSNMYLSSLVSIHENIQSNYELKRERLTSLRKSSTQKNLSKVSEDALFYIDGLKKYIIALADPKNKSLQLDRNNVQIVDPNLDNVLLQDSKEHPFNGYGLYQKVELFNSFLFEGYPDISTNIMETENDQDWMHSRFFNKSFLAIYSDLSTLQLEIASIEIEVLSKTK